MKSQRAEHLLSFSDAPTSTIRLLEDRKSSIERLTTNGETAEIPCPGGCGAMASLESPMFVTRGGVTRTIRMARCLGECRIEKPNSRYGKPRVVRASFEIPWEGDSPETTSSAPAVPISLNEFSAKLSQTMQDRGVTQVQAGQQIGISQSAVSKMLRGAPVSDATTAAVLSWLEEAPAPEEDSSEDQLETFDEPGEITLELPLLHFKERTSMQPESLPLDGKPHLAPAPQPPATELRLAAPPEPAEATPGRQQGRISTPYEKILRAILEPAAQQHLQQLAGSAADGIVVRVSLEWQG